MFFILGINVFSFMVNSDPTILQGSFWLISHWDSARLLDISEPVLYQGNRWLANAMDCAGSSLPGTSEKTWRPDVSVNENLFYLCPLILAGLVH